MNKNILKYKKQVEQQESKALGHEEMIYFYHGYLSALLKNKTINKKECNIFWKVYGWNNGDGLFYIDKNGNLGKYKE